MNPFAHLALAVTATALLVACGKKEAEVSPIRPVITQKVVVGAGVSRDVYSGELRARYEADLAFRVGGKVLRRHVDAGARVRRGQVLAVLDPQDARLAIEAAKALVAGAESDLAFAKAELDRNADLLAKNFISKAVFDNKQNLYAAAKARVDQARAQANINVNQAGYTQLIADGDGIVTSITAEAGQVVAAGQPVARLAKDGEREVVISVPEGKISQFTAGMVARAWLWADESQHVPAQVREINAAADAVTRTFTVRVTVPQLPAKAQLGMTASVAVGSMTPTQVVLPLAAIVKTPRDASAGVWVVNPQTRKVSLTPVTVASYGESGAVVSAGLSGGELVVVAGAHKLLPNQEVLLAYGAGTPPNAESAGSKKSAEMSLEALTRNSNVSLAKAL